MRKIAFAILLAAMSNAQADGAYDGIWQITDGLYSSIAQNGDQVIVLDLDTTNTQFVVSQGTISGNIIEVTTILGGNASVTERIEFHSETSGTSTLLACTPNPGFSCLLPIGSTIPITKAF